MQQNIKTLSVFLVLISCAGLQSCAGLAPSAPEGKALLLGDDTYIRSAQYVSKTMIRTVDGKETGTTIENPVYQVALEPGTHQIGAFCIQSEGIFKRFGPAKEITIQVEAGRIYKLKNIPSTGKEVCAFGGVEEVAGKKARVREQL